MGGNGSQKEVTPDLLPTDESPEVIVDPNATVAAGTQTAEALKAGADKAANPPAAGQEVGKEVKKEVTRDELEKRMDVMADELKSEYKKSRIKFPLQTSESYKAASADNAHNLSTGILQKIQADYDKLKAEKGKMSDAEFKAATDELDKRIKEIPDAFVDYLNAMLGTAGDLDATATAKIKRDTDKFIELVTEKEYKEILDLFKYGVGAKGEKSSINTDAKAADALRNGMKAMGKHAELTKFALMVMPISSRKPILEEYLNSKESAGKQKNDLMTLVNNGVISPEEMDALNEKFKLGVTEMDKKQCEYIYGVATNVRPLAQALTKDSIGGGNIGDYFTWDKILSAIGNLSGAVSGFLTLAVNVKTIIQKPSRLVELAPNLAVSGALMFNRTLLNKAFGPNDEEKKMEERVNMKNKLFTKGWMEFFKKDDNVAAQAFAEYVNKVKDEKGKLATDKITTAGFSEYMKGKPEFTDVAKRLGLKEKDVGVGSMDLDLQSFAANFYNLDIKDSKLFAGEYKASLEA
jgi:hypothetical protein